MKKEQRDIACSTRGQASNAIFYPESATRQFSRYSAFDLGVVFMSRRIPHICEQQMHFVRSLDVSRDRRRWEPLSVITVRLQSEEASAIVGIRTLRRKSQRNSVWSW